MNTTIQPEMLWEWICDREGETFYTKKRASIYVLYQGWGTVCQPAGAFDYQEYL